MGAWSLLSMLASTPDIHRVDLHRILSQLRPIVALWADPVGSQKRFNYQIDRWQPPGHYSVHKWVSFNYANQ